jgi:CD2 antigen cytoplasmic tail-binding protein 2
MPPKSGLKRAAAEGSASSSKKTRIVEPEDDPANFAEQVDAALEGPSRRGKVRNEGYESDSTDDEEGVVYSRRKGKDKEEEDDEDMFAMADKEDKVEEDAGLAKREEKFMRLGDIEGQEFNEAGNDDDDEEEEEEDETVAQKKKRDAMGFELSSFNMRDEMEEGKFTEDGTYVKTYDPHATHDKWMEGFTETEIKLARRRHKEQERKQKEKIELEEQQLRESGGQPAIQQQLLPLLKKGETVLEALQRLGAQAKRKPPPPKPYVHPPMPSTKPNAIYRKRKAGQAVDGAPAPPPNEPPKEPTPIEVVTELASRLMSLGDTDIYSKTYEEIVRSVRSAGNVEPNWDPPSADIKYEYKWAAPGNENGEVFGPFKEEELKAWHKAAYFGTYGEKVQARKVGGEWGTWDDVVE